jgi:hypothetical protein
MGNVGSRPDEGAPLYIRDQNRCEGHAHNMSSSTLTHISLDCCFGGYQRSRADITTSCAQRIPSEQIYSAARFGR